MQRHASLIICTLTFLLVVVPFGAADNATQAKKRTAKEIADDWLIKDDDGGNIGHLIGSGPLTKDFYAYSHRLTKAVSFKEAWTYYARKCSTDYKYREGYFIIGKDTDNGDRISILQRPTTGSRATTFSLHTKVCTVTVHLVDATNTDGETVVHVSLIITTR